MPWLSHYSSLVSVTSSIAFVTTYLARHFIKLTMEKVIFKILIELTFSFLFCIKLFAMFICNVYKLDALFLIGNCCNMSSLYDVFHIKCVIDLARKLRKCLRTIVTMLLNFDYILLLGFALWLATFPKKMLFAWILEWQILVLPFN